MTIEEESALKFIQYVNHLFTEEKYDEAAQLSPYMGKALAATKDVISLGDAQCAVLSAKLLELYMAEKHRMANLN